MNIWLQCAQQSNVSTTNPVGHNYSIQHGWDSVDEKLKDHVNGRRYMDHLPFGDYRDEGNQMPFDGYLSILSRFDDPAAWFKSYERHVRTMYDNGATEVICYLGSLPSCRRIRNQIGKPGRMDDIDRLLWQITRLPKECGCSLAFDATATIWEDWHYHWLKLQQAELAKWGLSVYCEATPFCTPYKSSGDYDNPNLPADKLQTVIVDQVGWPFIANRTYNEFPYITLESPSFIKRHITGEHKCFPLIGSLEWYATEVNVLSHSKDHEKRTIPQIREWMAERESQGVVPWVNLGVMQRLEP